MSTKTDNGRLDSKLDLRRYFLRRYHADGRPAVFDACQGSGVLWKALLREFDCRYWGVDVKPARGRLKIDSVRVLAQPGWRFEVIDIDTYGSPWKHWREVLAHSPQSVTVFLTIGATNVGGATDSAALEVLGLGEIGGRMPTSFRGALSDLATEYCLAFALERWHVVECKEAPANMRTRYIGIRLEPRREGGLFEPAAGA
jgi:hypothetical protein